MATSPTTPATDNVTALRTGYTAFAAGDMPVVLGLFDPEIEWTEPAGGPYSGTFRGPQGVVDGVFSRIPADWSDFRVEPDEFLPSGEVVVVLGTFRGTHGATGTTMSARFVHVWRFRDGRASHFEGVSDTASMNAAMT